MPIPLDRLYHYIESVAEDIRGDAVIIYRFFPHGSKKITDLTRLSNNTDHTTDWLSPHIYCNDQEPLNYDFYKIEDVLQHPDAVQKRFIFEQGMALEEANFRILPSIYDKVLLIHSEKRSTNLNQYLASNFIPVYYWSHAVISLDWFRGANYFKIKKKQPQHTFLIYNRAWSGTREYRLKFVDFIVTNNLKKYCNLKFNPIEIETDTHYTNHMFKNQQFLPTVILDNHFPITTVDSSASADFVIEDYETTDFEVVLETLFDDGRLHLTEKILRPIALGQPFILVSTCNSLNYLKSYGFKTFDSIIDESYDSVTNPINRLESVIKLMKDITNWSQQERISKLNQIKEIVNYNKQYFFSKKFEKLILNELKNNLHDALKENETTNTGQLITKRKLAAKFDKIYLGMTGTSSEIRLHNATIVQAARFYYQRNIQKD
jgi:hypothetical protein